MVTLPVVVVMVASAFVPTILNITVSSDILPTMASYLSWKSALSDNDPWAAKIGRDVPAIIMVNVIATIVADDILRPSC